MKIARRAMRRGVSVWGSVAQRPSLVGVETPPPSSEHDTPPRTASLLSISTVVLPPRGYRSRAFARNFIPTTSSVSLPIGRNLPVSYICVHCCLKILS